MATIVSSTSTTRVISVVPNTQCAVCDSFNVVSLGLVVYITHRELHRDVQELFNVSHSTDLAMTRPTLFRADCLPLPTAMRSILCDALGTITATIGPVIEDGDYDLLDGLASMLLNCYRQNGSAHLCAQLEVVRTTVVDYAIERLKVNCGFDPQGRPELGTCSICLDDLCCGEKKLIQTPCSHLYHESCIVSWLEKKNKSCPLCRRQVLF